MAARVIVYRTDEDSGRMVRFDGTILGRAFQTADIVELLRRAGLPVWDQLDVAVTDFIERRGGGPDSWTH